VRHLTSGDGQMVRQRLKLGVPHLTSGDGQMVRQRLKLGVPRMTWSRQLVVEVIVRDGCLCFKGIPEVGVHGASSAWVPVVLPLVPTESNTHFKLGQELL
jgi:hypothetical protein